MRTYDCPQCGAPVPFQSSVTVFTTCGFCRSMVVRRDANVELMGQQAELPPDLSPLQVGTRGEFDGQGFLLVGRVRLTYPEGAWTEWCADFGHGRWGWVAEAQGFYYVSFEVAVPDGFPGQHELAAAQTDAPDRPKLVNFGLAVGRDHLPVGRSVNVGGVSYTVRDRKFTTVQAAEGELTFAAVPGRTAISGDLSGADTAFANVEYSDDGIRIFVGRICRFEELKFSQLRAVPGWTTDAEQVRHQTNALNCPTCGAAVALRAAGFSLAAACGSCGSIIDAANPQLQLIDGANRKQVIKPLIELGTRGSFGNTEFECIGFLRRRDNYGEAWSEYLLFNPFAGFRWLVTYQGHWSFVEGLVEEPRLVAGEPVWREQPHKLFAVAQTEVTYVLGEFYWRVRRRERTTLRDFIAPPFVLSEENYPDLAEKTWSAGEYLTADVVQAAFRLPEALPEATGPYLNEPNPHRDKGRTLRWLFPALAVIFVLLQLFTAGSHAGETVLDTAFTYRPGETNRTQLTPVFEVKGGRRQALEFQLEAPVDNQWFEVNCDLINADTKEVREVSLGVEYYHGYDDGPWSEGSPRGDTLLPAVKPGRYYLAVDPEADPGVGEVSYRLGLVRDVTVWSNFWLGLGALMIYPVFRWWREHAFERARWSQSDFSPYASAGGDDDDSGGGFSLDDD